MKGIGDYIAVALGVVMGLVLFGFFYFVGHQDGVRSVKAPAAVETVFPKCPVPVPQIIIPRRPPVGPGCNGDMCYYPGSR